MPVVMHYQLDPVHKVLAKITSLEASLDELKTTVHNVLIPQADRIFELESMANPYSTSGQAICDSYGEDDYEDNCKY
jgi:hypothetical protein